MYIILKFISISLGSSQQLFVQRMWKGNIFSCVYHSVHSVGMGSLAKESGRNDYPYSMPPVTPQTPWPQSLSFTA